MIRFAFVTLTAILVVGCGGGGRPAAPTSEANHAGASVLDSYSEEVRRYYGTPHRHPAGDSLADIEAMYHQPPMPPEVGIGDTITLTGTNIGIRLRVTVIRVGRVEVKSMPYTAVELRLENTGIAVHDDKLRRAVLTDATEERLAEGVRAACSHGFDDVVRLDVGDKARGCLLFRASGAAPRRLQLALELVPVNVGGIWDLD